MKKIPFIELAFGILILFLIQSIGTLVESIYILDLMNTNLDEKALGVLYLFSPLLAIPFFKRFPRLSGWVLFAALLVSRGLMPYLNTAGRLPAAGVAVGASLSLFILLLSAKPKAYGEVEAGLAASAGMALAVALSTLLRTVNHGVEYSLVPAGGWVGWLLGLLLGGLLAGVDFAPGPASAAKGGQAAAAWLGIYLVVTLVYFVFSAPAVIARWTQGNYPLIVSAVSLFSLAWAWLAITRSRLLERITPRRLLAWNVLFTLSLTGTILAHRVAFPPALESPEVVVGAPTWLQQVPLGLMLLLFPVIFADVRAFLIRLEAPAASAWRTAPGILAGGFALILLVFMHIFTNVWGYVKPVSLPFRNAFWLPHFLLAAGLSLLAWLVQRGKGAPEPGRAAGFHWGWGAALGVLFLATALTSLPGARPPVDGSGRDLLIAMTYNVQQFNDEAGEKALERQMAVIRRASPDILAMQETDSNRISLNNNDYVRYVAEKLGYYAYYGPTPITGTYGTAILSKYPLENTRSVFIYSDKDETGVAEAEVEIGGRRFTVYNVHPDSSDPAMLGFARVLLARAKDRPNVIALGDYNLRDYEEAYRLIEGTLVNAWVSVYPSEVSPDGVDMSGENRIDHIFFSPDLKARNPVYLLPPESATDHPVHWTEIYWEGR